MAISVHSGTRLAARLGSARARRSVSYSSRRFENDVPSGKSICRVN